MQTVLITGATSGIGKQLAIDYASQGVQVWACGRNSQVLAELQQQHANINGLGFDLTDLEACRVQLSSLNPRPSVWIFNAGNCEYIDQGILDASLIKRVLDINVVGLCNGIEASQSQFQSGDRVVLVSSIAGAMPLPRAEAYGASKAAVTYLGKSWSLALKPRGIHVSLVYPGFVETPLTDKNDFEMPDRVSAEEASHAIRQGISAGSASIYFPKRFTTIIRLIGLLPDRWQLALSSKLIKE
ncbi:SDR family NAD(P)-dependent oxidoreductase [Vibrio sp. SCSIO 43136]|uniref:SDR family NAD(P)-dependent oxidoreductase n=1 Tax=Vibrio sp. SCSIO 43136 TaxID=2819101 RepID=UPI002076344D|nr:SDR family NAD(P)-dependent oxidoreductase [Vibrio sp. SCSIO 43136]USD66687.1 SDR family NAD(P)-dependent oxidoreductase [Vibrio sp. SCSIO 43136]